MIKSTPIAAKAKKTKRRKRKNKQHTSEPLSWMDVAKIGILLLFAATMYNFYTLHREKTRTYISPIPSDGIVDAVFAGYDPTPTPAPAANKGGATEDEGILSRILPLTRACGIPDALAASQWAVESGRTQESKINNYFGLGPHIAYPTLEANVRDYCLTVHRIAEKNGLTDKDNADAYAWLTALQSGKTRYEAHQEDPMHYVRLVSSTPEWRKYAK